MTSGERDARTTSEHSSARWPSDLPLFRVYRARDAIAGCRASLKQSLVRYPARRFRRLIESLEFVREVLTRTDAFLGSVADSWPFVPNDFRERVTAVESAIAESEGFLVARADEIQRAEAVCVVRVNLETLRRELSRLLVEIEQRDLEPTSEVVSARSLAPALRVGAFTSDNVPVSHA